MNSQTQLEALLRAAHATKQKHFKNGNEVGVI